MIPSRRRRTVAALGACLAGLAIAVVLITDAEEQRPTKPALASAEERSPTPGEAPALAASSSSSSSSSPSPAPSSAASSRASGSAAASSDGDGAKDEGDDDGREPLAEERSAPLTNDDGTPRDRPRPLGSLDKDAIHQAMQDVKPLLKACFDEALKHDPSLAGRVVVEFEIGAEEERGVVKQGTVVDSETASPFFEACVLQRVAGAEMPLPEGGGVVKVRYPFTFDPGGGFGGEAQADDAKGEAP